MKGFFKQLKLTILLLFAAPVFLFAQTGMNTQDQNANEVINNWPEASKKVAENMMEKYGEPDGSQTYSSSGRMPETGKGSW